MDVTFARGYLQEMLDMNIIAWNTEQSQFGGLKFNRNVIFIWHHNNRLNSHQNSLKSRKAKNKLHPGFLQNTWSMLWNQEIHFYGLQDDISRAAAIFPWRSIFKPFSSSVSATVATNHSEHFAPLGLFSSMRCEDLLGSFLPESCRVAQSLRQGGTTKGGGSGNENG